MPSKKKEDKIEATSNQSGFVTAKGSVSVKSGKKRKLEEPENMSASAKKAKAAQMIITSDNSSSPAGLTSYMKSGPLTQRLGQEDSRKSTSAISIQCLPVSRNI